MPVTGHIEELEAAVKAHQEWQQERGLVPGARIRHRYTLKDGTTTQVIVGTVIGYTWSGLEVDTIRVDVDQESMSQFSDGKTTRRFAAGRFGDEVLADPAAELEAERARLTARLAEIDAQLAALRA
jgi:hypothetical protein